MALNTARISEGLLSLRFPRTRLFAASAPVCIQVLAPCLSIQQVRLVRASTTCVGLLSKRRPCHACGCLLRGFLACIQVPGPVPITSTIVRMC